MIDIFYYQQIFHHFGDLMQKQFKEIIIKFYQKIIQNKNMPAIFKHSLQRYLSYVQLEQTKGKDKEKDTASIKSVKSINSNLSTDSFFKIKKLFHSTHLQIAIIFTYFLQIIKSKKKQILSNVLDYVTQRLKKYHKYTNNEDRIKFQLKFKTFSQQLMFLCSRIQNKCKIDWLYYEVFNDFESESILLAQLLSSQGQKLESLQSMKSNDYFSLLLILKLKCHVFDKQLRESKILGNGDIKLYIGRRGDICFIMSQKQFQLEYKLSKQSVGASRRNLQIEKQLKQQKKASSNKFKQQILAEINKLKQDYESNTQRIATIFNFKDSTEGVKILDESRQL